MNRAWEAWSEKVEARLAKIERRTSDRGPLATMMAEATGDALRQAMPSIEFDGERTLIVRSLGNETRHELPYVSDAGVWKSSSSYCRGDATSYGGSLWIAQRPVAAGEKPGHNDGWRLAVKKGAAT